MREAVGGRGVCRRAPERHLEVELLYSPLDGQGQGWSGGNHGSPDNTRHSTGSIITGWVVEKALISTQGPKLNKKNPKKTTHTNYVKVP